MLVRAHLLTCPHTWTHRIMPVYTSVHMHVCTRVHKHMLLHLYTFTLTCGHAHTCTCSYTPHSHCSYMPAAFMWHALEHMHVHVVCELPTSYPGQAIPRPGHVPGPCSPDLVTTAWQEPRPQLCHPVSLSPLALSPSGPLGPWSVLAMLRVFSCWVMGVAGRALSWQGAGGPPAVVFPGRGHAAVPEQT